MPARLVASICAVAFRTSALPAHPDGSRSCPCPPRPARAAAGFGDPRAMFGDTGSSPPARVPDRPGAGRGVAGRHVKQMRMRQPMRAHAGGRPPPVCRRHFILLSPKLKLKSGEAAFCYFRNRLLPSGPCMPRKKF